MYNNPLFESKINNISSKEILKSDSNSLPSLFASLVKYGCLMISKNTDFPFTTEHRIRIKDNSFLYKEKDIYPELSEREKNWFVSNKIYDYIPWKSGTQYYKIGTDTIYKNIADIYNQKMLTGLSGTTDVVLDVMSLFLSFNLYNSLYANIIWQCSGNVKDHTLFEILVATIPYGLKYTVNKDAEDYCRENNIIIPLYYEYPY